MGNSFLKAMYSKILRDVSIVVLLLLSSILIFWSGDRLLQYFFDWDLLKPRSAEIIVAYWQSSMVVAAIIAVVFLLSGRVIFSLVVGTASAYLFFLVNAAKGKFLDAPVVPDDLGTIRQALDILPVFFIDLWPIVLVGVLLSVGCVWAGYKVFKFKPSHRYVLARVLFITVCLFNFYDLFYNKRTMVVFAAPYRFNISYPYSKKMQYRELGAPLAFLADSFKRSKKFPNWYQEKAANKQIEYLEGNQELNNASLLAAMPAAGDPINVVLYLAESFFDPTRLSEEGVHITPDPMPFVRSMVKENGGKLIVPTFGGYTARTEFEVITGLSLKFLGETPYITKTDRKFGSFPEMLKKNGYHTYAIHPYRKWFWNRSTIYKNIGIDQYYTEEKFIGAKRSGPFVSDEALVDKIIHVSEKAKSPYFIFGITMSTHGPHKSSPEGKNFEINYGEKAGLVLEDTKADFHHYLRLLSAADDAIKNLISHYSTKKEKTIVVFFGDHLPAYSAMLKSIGYITDERTPANVLRKNTTPFFVWSNFETEKKNDQILSANFLLPMVTQYLPILPTHSFLVSKQLMSLYYSLSAHLTLPKPNSNFADQQSKQLLKTYKFMTYDAIEGKQYILNKEM